MNIICSNPWCKATVTVDDNYDSTQCTKCRSFDENLSGGVTWTEKKYEGPRFDGQAHQIDVKIERAFEKNKIKW